MSVVVFHRNFQRLQGGHIKVFHYFEHVRSSPSHEALIRFTPDSVWDASNPWWGLPETMIHTDESASADVLFLAGMGWRALTPEQRAAPPVPIINLIQYLPLGGRDGPLNQFFSHPAIRICVSPEIEDALCNAHAVEGPTFTVPIGLDLERMPTPRPAERRDIDCAVLAIKDRPLGRQIAERVRAAGYRVLLLEEPIPRQELLEAMARARITVHLPASVEGAYLPALESMALGAAVVCPDCVGNRSFCRDGDTCLVPDRSARALTEATLTLLTSTAHELEPMLTAAREEAAGRALSVERSRFLEILDRVDQLWTRA